MVIRFSCSSCGAPLKLRDHRSKVKCPKCSEIIEVPESAHSAESRVHSSADERKESTADPTSLIGGIRTGIEPTRPTERYRGRRGLHVSRKSALFGLAAIVLVLMVALVAVLLNRRDQTGLLVLDWPQEERNNAGVDIDGRKMPLPMLGNVEFRLLPGKHRLLLERPEYEPIEVPLAISSGQTLRYKPDWKRPFWLEEENDDGRSDAPDSPRRYRESFGSGFVVHADGFILTNHHVIEGAGKLFVHLPQREGPIPARVIAEKHDREQDIALLKIETPPGINLQPIALATTKLRRAEEVGAFGFPLSGVGSGVKFTLARVHATAEQTKGNMVMLDGRINPGNSGGPLCNKRGQVVGMVTAKTKSLEGGNIESYGMALPGHGLQEFLAAHLPGYAPPDEGAEQTPLDWADVDRLVSPSVVMIVNTP